MITIKNGYELLKLERPDLKIHKILKIWKSRHGFYWVKCKYSVNKGYTNFNINESETFIGEIPYPLSDFNKLSIHNQLETGVKFNKDEPISIDYIKRKIWCYICVLSNKLHKDN